MDQTGGERRLSVVLAADMVGYSRLMEADEAGTFVRLKTYRLELIDPAIARNHGEVVKTTGDGMLVEFHSVVDAVQCAVEIQQRMARRNADTTSDQRIEFRIGINLGDLIHEGNDVFGDGVNIAARLQELAETGGICVSGAVREQIARRLDVVFEDLGEKKIKNIARPVRVYRVDEGPDLWAQGPEGGRLTHQQPSVAILAFDNMSGEVEQQYFSDGISEDIITDLSKLRGLHVIARNSSFFYKGRAVPVPQVARELGVRYVLEGSVRRASNRVRITAQLIDSTTGGHVWADRYDRDLDDIFAVQDEVTRQIVDALKPKLGAADEDRLARRRSVDVQAYNLFLQGREQVWLHTRAGNLGARRLLGRAIAIEPRYAAAHANIAFTHILDYVNSWTGSPEQTLQDGLEIAQRAVAMDAEEPQAHFALAAALLWSREHDQALAEAERCLACEPGSAEGRIVKAHIEIYSGKPAAAIETIGEYMRLDPLHKDIVLHFLAEAHVALRNFEEAAAALEQRLADNPDSSTSQALLACCYGHLGRITESREAWSNVLRVQPDYSLDDRRKILPFRDPADFDLRVEGLRKAGIDV